MDAEPTRGGELSAGAASLDVNGRSYRWPRRPVAVICFDGCDPAYLETAIKAGVAPNVARMMRDGFHAPAQAVMPSFTNPNNLSIACGAPPSVHGVSGNYYLDRASGREVMMLDAATMRADTIPGRFSQAGCPAAVVTAKDKLRKALARGLSGIACSAEHPDEAYARIDGGHGFAPAPGKYSADLSLFVLDSGIRLVERDAARILYLSLSDYVQHAYAPEAPEALDFVAQVDSRLGRLIDLGAVVGVVADHGMSDMALPDGRPNVLFVGDVLDRAFGPGAARVICPITDPFQRHHASLGGFVRVYAEAPGQNPEVLCDHLAAAPGVAGALSGAEAAARFDLPRELEADIVVIAEPGVALGARAIDHDLSQLAGTRLRSHGGLAELPVPFLLSDPVGPAHAARRNLRNYDIFDFVLNGAAT